MPQDINFGVQPGGNVLIQQGDSYLAADGRALIWTEGSLDGWPDLTGATVVVQITLKPPPKSPWGLVGPLTLPGTILNPGGSPQSVSLDLPAAQSALFSPYPTLYRVLLKATLASSGQQRLADALFQVIEDPSLFFQIPWTV